MEKYIPDYPSIEEKNFYNKISGKYEFLDDTDQAFFTHQQNVSRFLSSTTLYNSLLLFHEMGTGKSGSAIATIQLIKEQDPAYKRIIILANGKTQLNSFKEEIFKRLPHLTDKYKNLDNNTILKREGYVFDTYRIFSKMLNNQKPSQWEEYYNHSIIIMDEIHNLISSTPVSSSEPGITNARAYQILYRFVHHVRIRKLLCMSGTPIRDKPYEIAKILNMVIPEEKAFPIGDQFRQKYLKVIEDISLLGDVKFTRYGFREEMKTDFQDRIRGYVSYLKKRLSSNVEKHYLTNENIPDTILKHFRIYGCVMNEPQNIYYIENFMKDIETGKDLSEGEEEQEEEKLHSLAYMNSKQASLFTFPPIDGIDETIGKKITEKYILYQYTKSAKDPNKSGKYLNTIGWTKNMKNLFPRTLNVQSRLVQLEKYSIIYSNIMKQIIENPSKLIYIYGFLKSGSGIYVLLSFMVEYFQFEIIKKISDIKGKATSKRRVLVLNHDFLSDNELRDCIEYFNSDDNCIGDYIQVVIGTKQTKEGITLKNIQQIHIIQPDWNYSDISQAISRGIRVGSHTALENKYPEKKISIDIFQYAAIPVVEENKEYGLSIDIEQYRRSELKDMNIKMIERELMIGSWDCQLNKEINTGKIDGDRECEYQACKYSCYGINEKKINIDYDTYNLYYSETKIKMIEDKMKNIFREIDLIAINMLMSKYFGDFDNKTLIYNTINQMIYNSTPIKNYRNDIAYLRSSHDYLFLVLSPFHHDITDYFYSRNPSFFIGLSFDTLENRLYISRFPSIILFTMNLYFRTKDKEKCMKIILQSSLELQELLLETILLLGYNNSFFNMIVEHYINQKRLVRIDDRYISTLLENVKRELDTKVIPLEWKTVEDIEEPKITEEETPEFLSKFIHNNIYNYYGIIERSAEKTIYKIRDVTNKELIFGKNKSKIPKGEICGNSFSKKKSGLIEILLKLKYPIPGKEILPAINEIKTFFKKKENSKIMNELSKKINIEQLTDNEWQLIYYLNKFKIPILCEMSQKRFQSLDLLYIKNI